ncbi:hypothetical protein OPIT5_06405 [Opitutaceae bacterium TAV5]|nr:hypothetical protein OPIT5_06405 [Opitutaceae bacterium TAV5]
MAQPKAWDSIMNRAAVIIGVKKAGQLPELKAALAGVQKVEAWASCHGFGEDDVITLTDEKNPVTAGDIKKAVKKLVDRDNVEQLFIYFAGHGVNLHYSEYWLLSDAPEDTQEAVNVAGSVQLAKRCGIPHVIFFSDACRTAPEGIQAQAIRGSEIFPNQVRGGPQKAVDVFYASLLGEPALEIQDKTVAAAHYDSLYTNELVETLGGQRRTVLTSDSVSKLYLRPQPLKRHLTKEVPKLVQAKLGLNTPHSQTPDAEILSDEFAFLQEFNGLLPQGDATPGGPPAMPPDAPTKPPMAMFADLSAIALQSALKSSWGEGRKAIVNALGDQRALVARHLSKAFERETENFGPTHFETGCGFKLRGAEIVSAWTALPAWVQQLSPKLVRVGLEKEPAANVLIELAEGRAVLIPAIHGFIVSLTFEKGELRNVVYEPSDTSERWREYVERREELTALRAIIASSVRRGVFRLERDDADKLTERIRYLKGLDPTLALYAAYSYHRLGNPKMIRRMEGYLRDDLNVTLFDLNLLAEHRPDDRLGVKRYPFVPLLAQGWSLLGAFDAWTPRLEALRPHVINQSLWTLFDKAALPRLRETLMEKL